MGDGITLHCPRCGKYTALKKEYDELEVKIGDPEYISHIPVYTCQDKECEALCAIEFCYRSRSNKSNCIVWKKIIEKRLVKHIVLEHSPQTSVAGRNQVSNKSLNAPIGREGDTSVSADSSVKKHDDAGRDASSEAATIQKLGDGSLPIPYIDIQTQHGGSVREEGKERK